VNTACLGAVYVSNGYTVWDYDIFSQPFVGFERV